MVNTCLVIGCRSRGSSGLYTVPQKNVLVQRLWIRACGRPPNFKVKNHHRICKHHFHPGAFTDRGHLYKGAVPGRLVYVNVRKELLDNIWEDHCYSWPIEQTDVVEDHLDIDRQPDYNLLNSEPDIVEDELDFREKSFVELFAGSDPENEPDLVQHYLDIKDRADFELVAGSSTESECVDAVPDPLAISEDMIFKTDPEDTDAKGQLLDTAQEQLFSCHLCPIKFSSEDEIFEHVNHFHGNLKKCDFCQLQGKMSVPLDLLDHHQNCHPDESTSAVLQSESDPLTEAEDYQFCDVKPTLPIVGQLECNLISFGKPLGQVRKNLKAARLKLELKSSRKLLASNQSIRPTETNNNSKQKALTDDCSNNTPQGVSHLLHNVKEDESNDQIQNPNTKKCKIKLKRNGFHNKKLKTTTIDPNTHAVHEPSKLKRKELNNKKLKTTTIDPNIHTVPEPPKLKRKELQNKKVKTTIMDPNIHTAHEPPTCIHCSRTFVLKTSLANHINKIHNDSNPVPFMPYHCQLCYRNFSNRKSHHEHRRTKHPTDPNVLGHFQCSLCPKSFACQMEFHTHYNNGHPGLHFHCGDCKIKFATSKELDEHTTARQHRAQTDTCRLCDQNFATRVQRLEHQSSQHPNISDKHCLPCDRKFPTLIAFWRHVGQVHYKGKSFQCELCGNEFPNAEYLKSHQICFHKTGNRYQCQHCDDAFGFKSLLDKHLIRHHPEHAPNQVCKICKEEFKQLRLLRAHEFKVHNVTYRKSGLKMAVKEKRFCDICDKVFSTGAYLTTHKQTVHEKIKKFSCSICNKTFGTKLYLKAHMNGVHLKKILYKCKICQKDFTYSSNLSLHVKTQH